MCDRGGREAAAITDLAKAGSVPSTSLYCSGPDGVDSDVKAEVGRDLPGGFRHSSQPMPTQEAETAVTARSQGGDRLRSVEHPGVRQPGADGWVGVEKSSRVAGRWRGKGCRRRDGPP